MLKIRLQGTCKGIKSFMRMLMRTNRVQVLRVSDFIPDKSDDKFYNVFLDIKLVWKMEDDRKHENTKLCRRFFDTGREQKSKDYRDRRGV